MMNLGNNKSWTTRTTLIKTGFFESTGSGTALSGQY